MQIMPKFILVVACDRLCKSKMNISVLGSTGSIGTQTPDVVDSHPGSIRRLGLAAGENTGLLNRQIKKCRPRVASVRREEDAERILKLKGGKLAKIRFGDSGNCEVATLKNVQKVVVATPGLAGISPTLAAIRAKKTIALA